MTEPTATRPFMPGYGILDADAGSGLLDWSWAEQRLLASRNYWLATVRPEARPHVMPVWALWLQGTLFFSGSAPSRKMINLRANPECVLTTEDAMEPVIAEGTAEFVTDPEVLDAFRVTMNSKYETNYDQDFFAPDRNAILRMRLRTVFALHTADFLGSPTRWTFPE